MILILRSFAPKEGYCYHIHVSSRICGYLELSDGFETLFRQTVRTIFGHLRDLVMIKPIPALVSFV